MEEGGKYSKVRATCPWIRWGRKAKSLGIGQLHVRGRERDSESRCRREPSVAAGATGCAAVAKELAKRQVWRLKTA